MIKLNYSVFVADCKKSTNTKSMIWSILGTFSARKGKKFNQQNFPDDTDCRKDSKLALEEYPVSLLLIEFNY